MRTAVTTRKDFWTGVLYIAIGLGALLMARHYAFGSTARMGPGYFPRILGILLIVLGAIIALRGVRIQGDAIPAWRWRPTIVVLGAVVIYGIIIGWLGLVGFKLAEVTDTHVLVGLGSGGAFVVMNKDAYDKLAAPQRAALEVALLRRTGRTAEAARHMREWRGLDPTSNWLRYEAVRLGNPDPALWEHLGADPDRVLDLASEYIAAGLYADAVDLLDRRYPVSSGLLIEPGAVPPQEHPEVAYYRGYAREKQGGSPAADYAAASKLKARFVFPSRARSLDVLRSALAANPKDATAHFLLGSLYRKRGLSVRATTMLRRALELDPNHRQAQAEMDALLSPPPAAGPAKRSGRRS